VAAEKLIERLKGREESSRILINGKLIVRESTAPPRDNEIINILNTNGSSQVRL
jgi:hypothetical protein